MAPRSDHDDDADPVDRRDESLLSAIPRNRRRIYDPYPILDAVVDRGSLFEIAPLSGRGNLPASTSGPTWKPGGSCGPGPGR